MQDPDMNREFLKVIAHIDQTKATLRDQIEHMDGRDVVELFRACAGGRLDRLDESAQLLAGLLAAMSIYDIRQNASEGGLADSIAEEFACPGCGEDDLDELVWLDYERVQCQTCRTIYKPGAGGGHPQEGGGPAPDA